MAQTWVYVNDAEFSADSNSANPSLPAFSVAAGNAIIVALTTISTSGYVTPSSLSDTAGNAYTNLATHDYLYAGTYSFRLHIYAAFNITGNADNVVTINLSAGYGLRCIAAQISGLAITGTQDTGFSPGGNIDTASVYTSGAGNTAADDELVFGAFSSTATSTIFSDSSPSIMRQQVGSSLRLAACTNHIDSAGSASISAAGSTNGAVIILARAFKQAAAINLSAAISGASSAPDLAAITARALLATISNTSTTPDISAVLAGTISLVAAIAGESLTPDLSASIARTLSAAISGQQSAPDLAGMLDRSMSAAVTGISAAPDLSAPMARLLAATVQAGSGTPEIPGAVVRELGASIAGASSAPDLPAAITRALLAAITGNGSAPDLTVSIQGVISLAASVAAASATPDMAAASARSLAAGVAGQSAAPEIAAAVLRALLATIAASTATPDIDMVLTNVVQLAASVQGIGLSPDLSALVARQLSAGIAPQSDAPAMWAGIDRALTAHPTGISLAPSNLPVLLGAIEPLITFRARPTTFSFRAFPVQFEFRAKPVTFTFKCRRLN